MLSPLNHTNYAARQITTYSNREINTHTGNTHIDTYFLKDLFCGIEQLSLADVYALCQYKQFGTSEEELQSIMFDMLDRHYFDTPVFDRACRVCPSKWYPNYSGHWESSTLYKLMNKQITKENVDIVLRIIEAIKCETPNILNVFKKTNGIQGDRYKPIPIVTANSCEIVAIGGSISCGDTELMSIGQFLGTCKDSLSGLDFSGLDLNDANLRGANCSETDFTRAQIYKLWGANLNGAKLVNVKSMCLTDLFGKGNFAENKKNILKVDWTGTEGVYVDTGMICDRLDMSNIQWTGLNLKGRNVHWDLTNATLLKTQLLGTKLGDCILDGTIITLDLPTNWNPETLDLQLNHLNNRHTGSLLTTINSINGKYNSLKINLVHQIIDSLGDTDISTVNAALADILLGNNIYLKDSKINAFIKNKIITAKMEAANTAPLKAGSEQELELFLTIVEEEIDQKKFMLEKNGFFIQLMMLCTEKDVDRNIQARAQQLYAKYLNLDELKAARRIIVDEIDGDILLVDGLEKNMANGEDLPAGHCFAFYMKVDDMSHFLILDRTQMKAMQRTDSTDAECRWDNIGYAQENKVGVEPTINPENMDLEKIFSLYPLFSNNYVNRLRDADINILLELMDLKYTNKDDDPNYHTMDYRPILKQGLSTPTSAINLCDEQHQLTLTEIFKRFSSPTKFEFDTYLKPVEIEQTHLDKVINKLKLNGKSDLTVGRFCYWFAYLFAKFSSTYLFGTENESPQAIRAHAGAWLISAFKKAPSVFGDDLDTQKTYFTKLMKILLGGKDDKGKAVFTCTAVAAGGMSSHAARNREFNEIGKRIRPPGI